MLIPLSLSLQKGFAMKLALRVRIITTLSAMLEFFDFTLLIFLAPVIAANFFPETSGVSGIMPVLMLFFAGYLARFFGGLFFGHGGDTSGRKRYYIYSIIVMSLSTLGIALLPGYAQWGIMAPIGLLVLRIFQGLSLGGEIPGAVVYASEYSASSKRGLATGLIVGGVTFGNVLASAVVSLLFSHYGEPAVYDWAWRIAFGLGAGLGVISLWLRLSLDETPIFESLSHHKRQLWPGLYLLSQYPFELLRGLFLSAVPAVSISVLFFMPRYQKHYLGVEETSIFSMSVLAFFILASMSFIMACLSDRIGRIPLMRIGSIIMATLIPASTFLLINESLSPLLALLPLLLAASMIMGIYEVGMVELFSTEARYSGVAFCHNLAFCMFGGLTPLLLEWLCSKGLLISFGLWPAFVSLALLILSFNWQDRYQSELESI